MKKFMIAASALLFSLAVWAAEPNEKVLASFHNTFKNVSEIVWNEVDGRFEVKFLHNSISTRVSYDQNGNILQTVRYYYEESLPILIRMKVQNKFKGLKVYGVTESTADGEVSYHIVLHDETNWVIVDSDAYGYIKIDKKFKKA
ncbi:MAG TPA: hypothetical protein VGB46_02060 [Flavisolibacter sp.]|jgi:hypothetical protein